MFDIVQRMNWGEEAGWLVKWYKQEWIVGCWMLRKNLNLHKKTNLFKIWNLNMVYGMNKNEKKKTDFEL